MFLKEALSIFSFTTGLFTISGFAIKVDKFESNHIFKDPANERRQLLLPMKSFHKLNLKSGETFKYSIGMEQRMKKISQIETHDDHATLIFEEQRYPENSPQIEIIKYYIESKPFWINLFK